MSKNQVFAHLISSLVLDYLEMTIYTYICRSKDMPKSGIQLPLKSAQTILTYLAENKISQTTFANTLEVTPRTLNNWLAGRHTIDPAKLQWIIHQVGIGLEDFFDGAVPTEYGCPNGVVSCVGQVYNNGVAATVEKTYPRIVKFFQEQISFTKFPRHGFFQAFEHDVHKGKNYYFQFWLTSEEKIAEAKFVMSFTIASNSHYAIRISYGEVLVKPEKVGIKQYFQPSDYAVQRPEKQFCVAKVATWLDEAPHTFVVNSDVKFKIVEKGRISEEELRRASDIGVFWKHFFFHSDE
jgi:transcriptional regulator with XRE-family HTH domain